MPWIGVMCESEAWELKKWAAHVRSCGGASVADLLERCAKVVGGEASGIAGADRMLEIESRASAAAERMRADAAAKAAEIVGRVMEEGVSVGAVMNAAGMDGWRDGSAAGGKNGGVAARRRKYVRGQGVRGADGQPAVLAEKGAPPLSSADTVARDARYASTWEAWAGTELRQSGFKMRAVAKGVGLDVTEAWRHVSAFAKHWRRERLAGRGFPGPAAGWADRLEEAKSRAMNAGVKGARVKLNGSGDCGTGESYPTEAHPANKFSEDGL